MKLGIVKDVHLVESVFGTGLIDLVGMKSMLYGFVIWAGEVESSNKLLKATSDKVEGRKSRVKGCYEFILKGVDSEEEAAKLLSQILGNEVQLWSKNLITLLL